MKQIRKNLITNILCLASNVIVGLIYTPYLIRELGVATYGVLPLALVINLYVNILTNALQNSVTRFYSVEYRNKNYSKASVFFSSAIAITIFLAVCVLPIVVLLVTDIEKALHIPDYLFKSVELLIIYTVGSFFISLISNCINITVYSENRLDLINYLKILRNLSKLLINVIIFTAFTIDVSNVGLSSLLAESFVLCLSVFFYKQTKHKEIVFCRKCINLSAMKPIAKMLMWVSLISLSNVFIYKMDTLLVNNYFGLYYAGILGSMSEFGAYCISITGIIGILFRPLMLIAYSEGRHNDLVRMTSDGAYISGLLSSVLCGIVMGLSAPLLKIWLNEEISQYSNWMVIKMLIIPITTFGSTFSIVYNLWNQVKSAALWSLLIAISYIGISVLLLELGIDMTTFLIIGSIATIAQGAILHIFIYKGLYPKSMVIVYDKLLRCCLFFVAVFISSYFLEFFVRATNIYTLMIEFFISTIFAFFIILFFIRKQDIDALDVVFPIKTIIRKFHS